MRTTRLSMRTIMTSFALLVCLMGSATAAPKRRSQPFPQTPPLLNVQEETCANLGVFVFNRAVDRDNGYALSTVLQASRAFDYRYGNSDAVREFHDVLTLAVFQDAHLSPHQSRQVFETHCMTSLRQQPATTPYTRY